MAIGHNFVVFAFISVPCDVNFEAVVFQEPPTIFYVADTGITDFAGGWVIASNVLLAA